MAGAGTHGIMPILTIHFPGQPPEDHSLHEEVVTIGRMTGNAIQLVHGSVSQSHARIMRVGTNYFLKDLKSTNGTLVNGQAIKETQLADGDQLKLGDVTAVFRLQGGQAPVPASAIPARNPTPVPAPPSASDAEKADTTILSSKAKTSLMRRPLTPVVEVNAPVAPPPKKRNSTVLLLSVLAGVAAAGIVGFLAWKFSGGDTPNTTSAATTNARPVAAQITLPPAPTPAKPLETTTPPTNPTTASPDTEATNAAAQAQAQRLTDLLATLRKPDLKERRRAAREISELGTALSNVVLNLRLDLVQDTDPDVRVWLVTALANNQSYDASSVAILIDGLKLENDATRKQACTTLALIPNPDKASVVPALQAAIKDESEEVRQAALAALKIIAPEEAPDK